MISFGTKVAVLPGTSYGGRFAGHTGTVCKWHRETNTIGVPLVRVEIQRRNELYRNVLEHWGEAGTPVADSRVRYPDIHYGTQNQSDIAE